MGNSKTKRIRDNNDLGQKLGFYEPMHNVLLVMPIRHAHELKYRAKCKNMTVVEYVLDVLKLDSPLVNPTEKK